MTRHDDHYEVDHRTLETLPHWSYQNPVTMVTTARQLDAAINRLLGHRYPALVAESTMQILGMDLEWKPMFEEGVYNRTALLQLYSPGCAVIIRLNKLIEEVGGLEHFKFPLLLRQLLENPHLLKVGLGVKRDAERLLADFGVQCQGCADIDELPLHKRCRPGSLAALAAIFMGIRISKREATSNWEAPRLSASQIRYAAADAYLSRELYLTMHNQSYALM